MKIKKFIISVIATASFFITAGAQNNPLWMRYPAISPDGKEIAFSYQGDIYKVSSNGGQAVRLTTNPAYDSKPVWSPDGKTIAFQSDRNFGSKDIYVMSATGGAAKRITTHSGGETPYTFTRDGKKVIFSAHIQDLVTSAMFPRTGFTELYQVSLDGGRPEMILPTPALNICLNKKGDKFVYQDLKGFENVWRKHHTSSVTRDIYLYDIKTDTHSPIVTWQGEDTDPVFASDERNIYFLSERSGSFNVYKTSVAKDAEAKQLTNFKEHPVRFLSIANDDKLCFGFDGEIYTMQEGQKPRRVNVTILNDNDQDNITPMTFSRGVTSAAVSPDGKQIAMVIRGEVFVTSADYSTTKQITFTPEAESGVSFGADNRSLVYASNRDGKSDLYIARIERKEDLNFPNATLIKEEKLIKNNDSEKQNPEFSPDGKEIAFVMDRSKLMVYNIANKSIRQITDGKYQHETTGSMNYSWSPDGKWFVLEYVSNNHAPYSDVGIVSSQQPNGKIHNLTNSGYFDQNPRWVMGGNAIIYSSEQYGMRNHASWGSMSDVMIVFLNREAYNKYMLNTEEYELLTEAEKAAKNKEEEEKKKEDKKKEDAKDKKDKKAKKDIVVEFDNIDTRIVRLTPNSSQLGDAYITQDGKNLYYMAAFEGGYDLWEHDLRKRSTQLLKKLNGSWVGFTPDKEGKNVFMIGGSSIQKMEVPSGKITPVSFRAEMKLDKDKERAYMYKVVKEEEAKRFYRKDMHGVNWDKLTKHYEKFLPYINNNYDFSEMLSELLGELNVSHTGSGYRSTSFADQTAELGLFLDIKPGKKGLKVQEIIVGGPFDNYRSKVKPGDILEKIDGNEITENTDYFPFLNGKVKKNVLVSFYSPERKERWDEVIKPISSGTLSSLLYDRWIKQRAAEVEKLSNGKLGYVHIPSMGDESFRKVYSDALGKYYEKEGIVIDIRYNGGGRLHEDIETFFSGSKYLTQVIRGKKYCDMPSRRWTKPSVMMICEADYSNAHGTPWVYKHMKIGKLVGMPVPGTMTSVNWVTLQDPTLYFGIPAVGYEKADGTYLENFQLEPDVKVKLDPKKIIKGEDNQIEAAVKQLLKDIK